MKQSTYKHHELLLRGRVLDLKDVMYGKARGMVDDQVLRPNNVITNRLWATSIIINVMALVARGYSIVAASSSYAGPRLCSESETMDKEVDALGSRASGLHDTVSLVIQRTSKDSSTNFDMARPKAPNI